MPVIVDSFNKNIYIGDKMVGYIGRNVLYINGHKFADISDDGIISYGEYEVGYVDDDNSIIIRGEEAGYIDGDGNFRFYNIKL